jgi:hypothetical protein
MAAFAVDANMPSILRRSFVRSATTYAAIAIAVRHCIGRVSSTGFSVSIVSIRNDPQSTPAGKEINNDERTGPKRGPSRDSP